MSKTSAEWMAEAIVASAEVAELRVERDKWRDLFMTLVAEMTAAGHVLPDVYFEALTHEDGS